VIGDGRTAQDGLCRDDRYLLSAYVRREGDDRRVVQDRVQGLFDPEKTGHATKSGT
jgi:hypothetical protein